ncbi:sn-glycerol-3-phosphate ABC transporter ATP-binding protein UgpC [Pelagibacterium halotolerans]|uniref:SN-glycerol-3-phosphate transport ATP-binding protein UgpC n=1 Tax=Pelagibacterium halotolerans (strain DSM 22347 / JCM 15775 / CGMCC 1.7692 / B2) TaxID=1082931 RepID=G4RA29_PELHB|nr:sn-glycerol-3-phosphate ABC transporter ATP-binding protein UgpC [Pelagibacterium halotolerans]AEQ53512.1 SN-glycerol-3-phosphate transport ATP-binding protein UgpC [Pelagibacterium halotolerans B2]QJR20311.1 sn-glycerol-3-phosphate ABC transporter ATP-binding protein UgpC [Pelagibacterium halotolerans]SEA58526.1 carbohydrate ABC transporter ATP-binding protein, CUT1 family [Pelagibacterium halotolerans]
MAAIEISSLRKVYSGNVEAIKTVDLTIDDGELVVLVGPSGCGKSTLLRMIAGLETITSGEVKIGDKTVNKLEPAERDIAMVFQNYALYPHMSVRGNLEYGLKNRKTPRTEIDERVNEAARILEIEAFLDRKPRQLSGGQRQRVAMGRAIVRKPKAFLFDEPLSNLDAKLRGQMRVEIRRLQRTLGTTSVYVTHDQLEAMTLADKLVVMNGGQIEQVGKPLDIYTNPASVFVAGFMGSPGMNLLDPHALGRVAGNLPGFVSSQCGTIGIRPEDIALVAPSQPHLTLEVIVDAVELVGSESLVYAHAEGIDKELVLRTQGIHPGEHDDKLSLYIQHSALHCFDAATGRKITR